MQATNRTNLELARQMALRYVPTPLHRLDGRRRHWLKARLAEKHQCSPLAVELLAVVSPIRPQAGFELRWHDALQELHLLPKPSPARRRPFRLISDCAPQTWVLGMMRALRHTSLNDTRRQGAQALPSDAPPSEAGRLIQILIPSGETESSKRDFS